MVKLTKLNGAKIIINSDEIETVETQKDTSITLKSGKILLVQENADEIYKLILSYKKNYIGKESE